MVVNGDIWWLITVNSDTWRLIVVNGGQYNAGPPFDSVQLVNITALLRLGLW